MKHLLIVGNGFVGKVTQRLFLENDWQVTTVSRNGPDDYHADLASAESIARLASVIAEPTHVLHCASAGGGGADKYRQVYFDGVNNLIDTFSDSHILFTSSTSVYPQTDGERVTEISKTNVSRETGNILLDAERSVIHSNGTVVRLAGLYGDGRSYLIKRFLEGQAVMEKDGSRFLNHTHHQDAARAILFLCENEDRTKGEIYNVCDNNPMTQLDTYKALAKIFSKELPPFGAAKSGGKRGWSHKAVSNAKMRGLGWEPAHPSLIESAEQVARSLV